MNKKFIPGKTYIPASYPSIGEEEYVELLRVLRRGWFTEGKACGEFAGLLLDYVGQQNVVLCNSGSSADLLAVAALSPFEEAKKYVVTCAVGFPTTLTAIYHNNLIPLYIDIDPKTLAPSLGHLQYVLEHPEYKDDIVGAILTHNLGFPYDEKLAKELLGDRWLISDCCDALGSKIYGNHVGHYSDISTYSFFPAHHITTAEGGAVCTNDNDLYDKLRSLNNWGRDCYCAPGQKNVCGKRFCQGFEGLPKGWDHKYTFTEVGYNLKMTDLQAALGIAQMKKIFNNVLSRQENLMELLQELDAFIAWLDYIEMPDFVTASPFGFPITVTTDNFTAQELIEFLESKKIGTRRMFGGNLKRQPAFQNLPYASVEFEGSDYVMERTFWIGCGPWMSKEMIDYIYEVFEEFFIDYV
jgi:CDP-6-deoxy-D-xylo-4-hexulose-3-dehydrase